MRRRKGRRFASNSCSGAAEGWGFPAHRCSARRLREHWVGEWGRRENGGGWQVWSRSWGLGEGCTPREGARHPTL